MVTLMIVDDSLLTVKIIKGFFEELCPVSEEFELIVARDGDEAVTLFSERRPYIVFMDITMPHLDGLSALKKIKDIDVDARVIMVTSHAEEKIMTLAMSDGAIDYLLKPLRKEDFQKVLEEQLGW
jgi:two-component system, chemotaxis family, chemotaxis protein CheY